MTEKISSSAITFQISPDFKGIKTEGGYHNLERFHGFQISPDFKGIKTISEFVFMISLCFKSALISKGLRHF